MKTETLACWLATQQAPGIGAQTLRMLLERFGSVEQVCAAPRRELERALGGNLDAVEVLHGGPDPAKLEETLAWLETADHHLIGIEDEAYPPLLRELADAPLLLYAIGDPDRLRQPQLAMVGSRNPTPMGRETAHMFAAALARSGLTITSGLALGIDGAAHEGALDAGGSTIAVAGTGLDRVYPARHRELAHRITHNGVLISEYPLGTPPRPENFPRRNRIISGMSVGVLVVEAALQSGSLITARLGAEQGREVFAIPGSIHAPQARGCHALIRQGAKLVETASDILEELSAMSGLLDEIESRSSTPSAPEIDQRTTQILENMGFDPVNVDVLVDRSGLTAEVISSMLLEMELRGLVESCPGGQYQRTLNH